MCGSCEHGDGRRWTSARLILLAFVATLLFLSIAGVIARVGASDTRALAPCAAASTAAVRFQAAVTRDLRDHKRLHSDATEFASELRSLGATDCPATVRFLRSAEETLGALCKDCAVEIRRARPATS
ncbi:MAG: hypothetical protein H0U05_07850 [Actinobacteria bacterium]|nr:hypothetical protein [Actinomycetota bacterium]